MVKIAIRADASSQIGIGHVMRCLTLADALALQGAQCWFMSRTLPGRLADVIEARGHVANRLPVPEDAKPDPDFYGSWLGVSREQDACDCSNLLAQNPPDLLIVDHYALDATWQRAVLPTGARLLVLDDLADRPHVCDVLLDQNLGRRAEDYDDLAPDHAVRLIGPAYALLRPEFAAARRDALAARANRPSRQLLISMGGADKYDATSAILQVLSEMVSPDRFVITVVMGPAAANLEKVRKMAADMPVTTDVLSNVTDMAPLMAQADLAIGGAGSTSWERCALGLPAFLLTTADNQWSAAQALETQGAAVVLGDIRTQGWQGILETSITRALQDPEWLRSLVQAAADVCDGSGAARATDAVMDILRTLDKQGLDK